MVTERPIDVMVLAMNVRGDGATDTHLPGTGSHGNEPPLGETDANQVVYGHARIDPD
jgi:hypothetical protein